MVEYWYRYRDDLWKKVTIWEAKHEAGYHPRKPDAKEKSLANIRRAARTIEGYALCNEWQWFGTFTLNPACRDRTDLDGFRRDFMQYVRNTRRTCPDFQALLVPELHRNKEGWHMHGLIQGLPVEMLRLFTLSEKLPKYIRQKLKAGQLLYDWPGYRERFGWVDIEAIRSRDAAARYITKYITKGKDETAQVLDLGKHLYYATRGLRKPERMEVENAPGTFGAVPDAFPSGLVEGNSYPFEYGFVTWYECPYPRLHQERIASQA